MSKVFLTSAFVKGASCPSDRRKIDYFDVQLPGFLIEVRATGGKTYYQRYRTPHGRERQFKIGAASVLTVQQARRKAKAIAAAALIGTDPQETRSTLRQMPIYRDFLMNEYMPFAKSNKRSWRTDLAVVRTHVVPNLGRLFMDQVTPSVGDWASAIDAKQRVCIWHRQQGNYFAEAHIQFGPAVGSAWGFKQSHDGHKDSTRRTAGAISN